MTETQRPDRRRARHAATKQEILDAAWRLAHERGLGGWSLRDVADAVGMRAPSLYVYFASKNAVFDAMFADGADALLSRVTAASAEVAGRSVEEVLHVAAQVFFDFCTESPARYQLLFLRTLPGFAPSAASYALAQQALAEVARVFGAVGLAGPEHLDLWTALTVGLVTQQLSNDPGGDRWRALVPAAVEMFLSRSRAGAPPTIGA